MASYRDHQNTDDAPDFEKVVDPHADIGDWLWNMRQSPTLRKAMHDAEEHARTLDGDKRRIGRTRTMKLFCDVVKTASVAEAIHQGSLKFHEVVGLRGQQQKAMGAVAWSQQEHGT